MYDHDGRSAVGLLLHLVPSIKKTLWARFYITNSLAQEIKESTCMAIARFHWDPFETLSGNASKRNRERRASPFNSSSIPGQKNTHKKKKKNKQAPEQTV